MSQVAGPVAGAGEPRRRKGHLPKARRVVAWLTWWVLLMALWVWIDDTLLFPELVVGAVAAGLGATLAELAQYQAATHVRMRSEWLSRVVKLPVLVLKDTFVLLAWLFRLLVKGVPPPSGFREEPFVHGGDDNESDTWRAFMLAVKSTAPNTLVLGIDPERDVMVSHQLVRDEVRRRRG